MWKLNLYPRRVPSSLICCENPIPLDQSCSVRLTITHTSCRICFSLRKRNLVATVSRLHSDLVTISVTWEKRSSVDECPACNAYWKEVIGLLHTKENVPRRFYVLRKDIILTMAYYSILALCVYTSSVLQIMGKIIFLFNGLSIYRRCGDVMEFLLLNFYWW